MAFSTENIALSMHDHWQTRQLIVLQHHLPQLRIYEMYSN
ncbi:hypothetical protein K661_01679 [Piscirickettsia salmonis LF-89 = ATCC VR-1361]|nr:hypothetical protein K661_01679 [Piscirickettsia salmonis LF-89 = ATCC VR-1361]